MGTASFTAIDNKAFRNLQNESLEPGGGKHQSPVPFLPDPSLQNHWTGPGDTGTGRATEDADSTEPRRGDVSEWSGASVWTRSKRARAISAYAAAIASGKVAVLRLRKRPSESRLPRSDGWANPCWQKPPKLSGRCKGSNDQPGCQDIHPVLAGRKVHQVGGELIPKVNDMFRK